MHYINSNQNYGISKITKMDTKTRNFSKLIKTANTTLPNLVNYACNRYSP